MKQLFISVIFVFLAIESFAQRHTSYTVKEGETIDYIAKVYRVSPNDIYKLNPDIPEKLKKGMLLVIPDFGVTHYSKQKPISFKKHSVKGQETLFGLTHQYNITIDDIKRYNQELYTRELQVGEEITIPVFSKEVNIVEKGRPGLKKHVVAPGEGLWRIAKNYNITQNVLEKLNPGITESLSEGQEIWVPSGEVELDKKVSEGMVLYRVEKGEGFMSLQRKFGLTERELIALNPELREGVKLEAEIWIPKERFYQFQNQDIEQGNLYKNSNLYVLEHSVPNNVYHIAYILPFKLGSQSDINFFDLKQKLQSDKLTQVASDFYLGARIAMDSLAKRGYKFKAQIFDSDASLQGIRRILLNPELEKAQVIIGPFLPQLFNELSQKITNPATALLVPVSNSTEIKLRSNVYQTIPSLECKKNAMVDYILNTYGKENILVIADGENMLEMEKVVAKFPNNGRLVTNIEEKSIGPLMSSTKENIVIIDSNNLIFLSDILRSLHSLQTSKKGLKLIRLVALDRGSAFDNNSLSNTQLSNLHFTYPTVNRFSSADNSFSKKYEQEYGILPNRYIIRGFDMTMDALLRLGVNSDFKTANQSINETSYVENKFTYKANFIRGGGFENMGVYIVEYNNLEIKELSQNTPNLIIE